MSTQAAESVKWEAARDIFEWDGSWRDIYVFETTVQDWDSLLRALAGSSFDVEFTRGGKRDSLPRSLAEHFSAGAERPLLMLTVVADGVRLNAHMFCDDEIEFDFDPREISTGERFEALVGFMNFTADALTKAVALTPENSPQCPLLVAHPGISGISRTG